MVSQVAMPKDIAIYNYLTSFEMIINNNINRTISCVYCDKTSLVCSLIATLNSSTIKANFTRVIRAIDGAYFLVQKNNSMFRLPVPIFNTTQIDYNIVYTFSEGINRVFKLNETWVGLTDASIYEMQIKADGSLQKKHLIFSCAGTIYDYIYTHHYMLIKYSDMPGSTKFILMGRFYTEGDVNHPPGFVWKGYFQGSNLDLNVKNMMEWNGFVLYYSLENILLFKPLESIATKPGYVREYSAVSLVQTKFGRNRSDVVGVLPSGDTLNDLLIIKVMFNQSDSGDDQRGVLGYLKASSSSSASPDPEHNKTFSNLCVANLKINQLQMVCNDPTNTVKLQNNSLDYTIVFANVSESTTTNYTIHYNLPKKPFDWIFLVSTIILFVLFLSLSVFTISSIKKVEVRKKKFRKVIEEYIIEFKPSIQKRMKEESDHNDKVDDIDAFLSKFLTRRESLLLAGDFKRFKAANEKKRESEFVSLQGTADITGGLVSFNATNSTMMSPGLKPRGGEDEDEESLEIRAQGAGRDHLDQFDEDEDDYRFGDSSNRKLR